MESDPINHICSSCRRVKQRDMIIYIIDLCALLHLKFHVACSLLVSLFNYCSSSSVGNISTNIWVLHASGCVLLGDFLLNDPEDEDKDLVDHTKSYFGNSLTLMKGSFVGIHLIGLYYNLGDWLLLSLLFIAAATFRGGTDAGRFGLRLDCSRGLAAGRGFLSLLEHGLQSDADVDEEPMILGR